MGFRFSKRISILPGVRINVSATGLGLSVGPRGASLSFNKNGIYGNAGLPGTGLSYRTKLSGTNSPRGSRSRASGPVGDIQVILLEDGTLKYLDSEGTDLSGKHLRDFKSTNAELIQGMLADAAQRMNEDLDACLHIHHRTTVLGELTPPPEPFDCRYKPRIPPRLKAGLIDRLFGRTQAIAEQNCLRDLSYQNALSEWQKERDAHEEARTAIINAMELVGAGHVRSMEVVAEYALNRIVWPRETDIVFGISECGRVVGVDLDLPDEDELPSDQAVVSRDRLVITKRTEAQRRRDFVNLAYGSVFRVAGELFASLPSVNSLVISSYIQRTCPGTGEQRDHYVMSSIIKRQDWSKIDFSQIQSIDPCAALRLCKLRVKTDRTSRFTDITPYEMRDAAL